MNSKPKFPFFDALGLPISPEISWESVRSGVASTVKIVEETTRETVSLVSGKFDTDGNFTDFQTGRAKTPELIQQENKANELRRPNEFFRDTQQDLGKVAMEKGLAESLKAKRIQVNTVIKGISNVLYEDIVKDDGTLRDDAAVEYAKKNSELDAEQLNVNRQDQIALATGAKRNFMGENELLLGGENKQHFTNLPG